MRILHTEASGGYGGQEIRILREAIGLRERGHQIVLAVQKGGGLVGPAREAGLKVYELHFKQKSFAKDLCTLKTILRQHQIDIINTHSSWDSWLGGCAARLFGVKVLRTRHLSTKIRPGLNSRVLYNWLADRVVTTCEETANTIRKQAHRHDTDCYSVPTGVDLSTLTADPLATAEFREKHQLQQEHCVIGTACVFRSWKGLDTLLHAAKELKTSKNLRWVLIGDGPGMEWLQEKCRQLEIDEQVIFTGYLTNPLPAIAALDVFSLLSTGNEGVSQAVLQAAALSKPLVTTTTGGLKEICLHNQTGLICPVRDHKTAAEAFATLADHPNLRQQFGNAARRLVEENFSFKTTLDQMEHTFQSLTADKF